MNVTRTTSSVVLAAVLLAFAGCGSTTSVDMEEESRVLGFENNVRVDALFYGLSGSGRTAHVSVIYEIENRRTDSIGFAEMVPVASFDSETGTFTVIVGSEVPGQEMLPRLIEIKPGERISMTTAARLVVPAPTPEYRGMPARDVRLKAVYLENIEPFRELIDIPEVAIKDAERADELFLPWVENSRSVTTNAVPLRSRNRRISPPSRDAARP